jgi:hypothetical protein
MYLDARQSLTRRAVNRERYSAVVRVGEVPTSGIVFVKRTNITKWAVI